VEGVLHGWVLVVLMLVFVAFFAVGSGPVTWVLLAEVLPPNIKGPAASLAAAAGWAGEWMDGWVPGWCMGEDRVAGCGPA
jgi:MFS family permease